MFSKLKLKKDELRPFFWLLAAAVFGQLCVIPMATYIVSKKLPENLPKTLFIAAINAVIIYGVVLYFASLLVRNSQKHVTPFISRVQAFLLRKDLIFSIVISVGLICSLGLLSQFFSWLDPDCARLSQGEIPLSYGLLASFYGGINEEILCRYFLLSLLIAPFKRSKYFNFAVLMALFITSILFGLGHLPATAKFLSVGSIAQLPGWVIVRALLLNGIAGIVFGLIFFRRGLEIAMITHFFVDAIPRIIEGFLIGIKSVL
jgi:membrane protease YdiL (CAAX protease family)